MSLKTYLNVNELQTNFTYTPSKKTFLQSFFKNKAHLIDN